MIQILPANTEEITDGGSKPPPYDAPDQHDKLKFDGKKSGVHCTPESGFQLIFRVLSRFSRGASIISCRGGWEQRMFSSSISMLRSASS